MKFQPTTIPIRILNRYHEATQPDTLVTARIRIHGEFSPPRFGWMGFPSSIFFLSTSAIWLDYDISPPKGPSRIKWFGPPRVTSQELGFPRCFQRCDFGACDLELFRVPKIPNHHRERFWSYPLGHLSAHLSFRNCL